MGIGKLFRNLWSTGGRKSPAVPLTVIWKMDDLAAVDRNVTRLRVSSGKIRNIDFLKDFPNLKYLWLDSSGIPDLSVLTSLGTLEKLDLVGLVKVWDLAPVATLKELKELTISTYVGWDGSGKTIRYQSLAPLSSLEKLELLRTSCIEFAEDGLCPLLPIQSLKQFKTSNHFTTSDFALLEKYRPDIKCKRAHVYDDTQLEYYKCAKCGAYKVVFSGKDLPRKTFCLNCNKKKTEELLARYQAIMQEI